MEVWVLQLQRLHFVEHVAVSDRSYEGAAAPLTLEENKEESHRDVGTLA